jgi:hypothetical protein
VQVRDTLQAELTIRLIGLKFVCRQPLHAERRAGRRAQVISTDISHRGVLIKPSIYYVRPVSLEKRWSRRILARRRPFDVS